MLHFEHMQRQRREQRRVLSFAEPESTPLVLAPAEEPESQPALSGKWGSPEDTNRPRRAFAERDQSSPAVLPAEPESLGDPIALRLS